MLSSDQLASPSRRLRTGFVAALLAATLLLFLPAVRYGWVGDDPVQIVANPRITSASYIPSYFTKHLWFHMAEHAHANYYRPAFLLWLLANFKLWGTAAAGWHLTSIIAHIAAAFFLYRMVRELTPQYWVAWITTAVFAVHAAHLESVAYISGVCDPIMARGIFAGLYWFLRYRRDERSGWRAGWLALSCVAFLLAMLAKEPGVVFPFLAVAAAWTVSGGLIRRDWLALSIYAILLGAYFAARIAVLGAMSYTITPLPLSVSLLTVPSVAWLYVSKLLLPINLSYHYQTPYVASPATPLFFIPVLALLACALLAWLLWRKLPERRRILAFGAALLLIPLLPAFRFSNMFWSEIAHDRYLYVPVAGFALLLATCFEEARLRWPRATVITFACWLAAIVVLTATELPHWRDRLTLYENSVRVAPQSAPALFAYATELSETGKKEEAVEYFRRGVAINPANWGGNFNLGAALFDLHRFAEAETAFRNSAAASPTNALSQYQIAMCRLALDDVAGAEMPLRRAAELEPDAPNVHFALAQVLEQRGLIGAAKDEYREELRVNPASSDARERLDKLSAHP